ncbi:BgTH12-05686 [Blumeria graminis f. sp. triticale]|uniref:BgTH12-05686 n=1 Tax=Blumeria graminis f. sp. triticale TaxID=1689686 RepID=A0A9W4D426_BLUGR|nr:BgTH12-05686 [Blumeria graminis f. sp. triticale]
MESIQEFREQVSSHQDSSAIELSRSVSTASSVSLFSMDSCSTGRNSFGSSTSFADTTASQSSLASGYSIRRSIGNSDGHIRRGYVRPQGTNFAASAKSRESVLSLGSIAHLQYYFARTGLLDGKGGRLARKKDIHAPEMADLDTSFISSSHSEYEASSPETSSGNNIDRYDIPREDEEEEDYTSEDDEHPHMLPPTVSTYNHREKYIPRPPSLEELRHDLETALSNSVEVLDNLNKNSPSTTSSPSRRSKSSMETKKENTPGGGWHEVQGMHVLDIMTLALRAAKMYYTAHNQPTRLASITTERKIRSEMISVMEVLRKMATRNFTSGVRIDEFETMKRWVESIYEILRQEAAMEESERAQCANWKWLDDSMACDPVERELAFIQSMDPNPHTLPEFKSVDDVLDEDLPTEFLRDFRTGLRLVNLHNAVVRKSKRSFGAIEKWHTDFQKPYRCSENLQYWIKAAELRFEVILQVDVMGVVHSTDRAVLKEFEDAIWKWCSTVRQEISAEIKS